MSTASAPPRAGATARSQVERLAELHRQIRTLASEVAGPRADAGSPATPERERLLVGLETAWLDVLADGPLPVAHAASVLAWRHGCPTDLVYHALSRLDRHVIDAAEPGHVQLPAHDDAT